MKLFESDNSERGQVGIGTLIVFIAMVLVAAIAAGVLINTAGFLQSQAEDTGQESTDQVANHLDIATITGQADAEGEELQDIEMTVSAGAGSDPISLDDVEVLFTDGDGAPVEGDLTEVSDVEEDTLIESDESVTFQFDDGDVSISEGDDGQFVFTTADGSQVEEFVSAPDPLDDEETYTL